MKASLSKLSFTVTTERLNASGAKEILSSNFNRNRNISTRNVKVYADRIQAGTFANGSELIFAKLGEETILVDGQHRLMALAETRNSVDFTFKTYKVNTKEQLLDLYSTIDIGFGRTVGHSVKAHDLSGKLGLTTSQSNVLAGACRVILSKFNDNERRFKPEFLPIIEEALTWGGEARQYFSAVAGAPIYLKSSLRRGIIVAIALHMFRDIPSKATEFWDAVATGQGNRTAATRKLHEALASAAMNEKNRVGDQAIARLVSSAWHSFYLGSAVQALRPHAMDKPLRIHRVHITSS